MNYVGKEFNIGLTIATMLILASLDSSAFEFKSTINLKPVYGLARSLEELQSETLQEQTYRSGLIDYINKSDIYSYPSMSYQSAEEKADAREKLNWVLPSLSLERLEELAKEIMTNGNPFRVLAEVENERLAPAIDTLGCAINPKC